MKILITNTYLTNFYGSQVFVYTLASELQRQGHEVICYSPTVGRIAEPLRDAFVTVTDDLASVPRDIDVIHAHHRHETLLASVAFPDKPMIMVCHGVIPWQEQPLKSRLNIFKYVAVSEEIKDHLIANHNIAPRDVVLIRNAIDTTRFSPKKPINETVKNLLILSNHTAPEQLRVVTEACSRRGISLKRIGFPAENIWNVEDYINDADVVVTLGRGALEASHCQRVVIVYDYNGADGLLTAETFPEFRKRNFSGRTNRDQYTVEEFMAILDQYDPQIPPKLRQYLTEYDFAAVTRQYQDLYRSAIKVAATSSPAASHNLLKGVVEVFEDLNTEVRSKDSDLYHTKAQLEQLRAQLKAHEEKAIYLEKQVQLLQQELDMVHTNAVHSNEDDMADNKSKAY